MALRRFVIEGAWNSDIPAKTYTTRFAARRRVKRFLFADGAGNSRHRRREGEFTQYQPDLRTLDEVGDRIAEMKVGQAHFVQRKSDTASIRISRIKDVEDVPNRFCAPQLEVIIALTVRRWGANKLREAGIFNCRFVDGTKKVSLHGYTGVDAHDEPWVGAAWDVFPADDSRETLRLIALGMVSDALDGKTHPSLILVEDRQWTPVDGWRPSNGAFHSHVHVQVRQGSPCSP